MFAGVLLAGRPNKNARAMVVGPARVLLSIGGTLSTHFLPVNLQQGRMHNQKSTA